MRVVGSTAWRSAYFERTSVSMLTVGRRQCVQIGGRVRVRDNGDLNFVAVTEATVRVMPST